ncbi:MAG: sulfurtransferase complex subunit TusD [Candidatus Dasytiphilus stammeri]
MKFVLLVTGPAYGTQNASSAYLFADQIVYSNPNHYLDSIFFYGEGIYNANRFSYPAVDEFDLVRAWQKMNIEHGINLNVCSSAAMRRGVGFFTNNKTLESINNLESGFNMSGLATLVKSILTCDRLVQF